jgi:dTDP-4-dehydrorhamnose reductase
MSDPSISGAGGNENCSPRDSQRDGGSLRVFNASNASDERPPRHITKVLIVGGTGYLGRHLYQHLRRFDNSGEHRSEPRMDVRITYRGTEAESPQGEIGRHASSLDLLNETSVRSTLRAFQPDVVINAAAISQPGLCEQDEDMANEINVPRRLVSNLHPDALLIHLSTDQVYDGTHCLSNESTPTRPVNAYGRSKRNAEEYIKTNGSSRSLQYIVLRSSIIVGPEVRGVKRPLFAQFIRERLQAGIPTDYVDDEYRNPIYVGDICRILEFFILEFRTQARPYRDVFNMGGPERLSRLDMARIMARFMELDDETTSKLIVSCKSRDLARPYDSPQDISMDSRALYRRTGISCIGFKDMIGRIFL